MWSEHWSDEQLIAHLYGIGPEDGHLAGCGECRSRLAAVEAYGKSVLARAGTNNVPVDFLARQRRAIYARLEERRGWLQVRRLAPGLAALALAAGIAVTYEHRRPVEITDAELVRQVSQMAENPTPHAIAPIEALFEE